MISTRGRRRRPDESGATAAEYVIIAAGIAVAIVIAVIPLGQALIPFFTDAAAGI